MSLIADMSMSMLHSRVTEDASWCTLFIVEEGAMTVDQLVDHAEREFDPAAAAPVLDRYTARRGTEDGAKHGLLTDQNGTYHATALGHRYVRWIYKQMGG